MRERRTQSGGDHSVNVQAEVVRFESGLSYSDVRDIALDVFRNNHHELSRQAASLALARAEELTDSYLRRLAELSPDRVEAAATDPGVQVALYEAQRDYASAGDPVMGDILVDLLVQRSVLPERTLQQVIVTESLKVAHRLTVGQLNSLTCNFVVRRTRSESAASLDDVVRWMKENLVPFVVELPREVLFYEHLTYAGCAYFAQPVDLLEIMRRAYSGKIMDGDLPAYALRERAAERERARERRREWSAAADGRHRGHISERRGDGVLDPVDHGRVLERLIRQADPALDVFFDIWLEPLNRLELTTVGLALGHANWRRLKGVDLELTPWLVT